MDFAGSQHVAAQTHPPVAPLDCSLPPPSPQRGTVQLEPRALVDLRQAVERQMIRQRALRRPFFPSAGCGRASLSWRSADRLRRFQILQPQFQLLNVPVELPTLASKLHPPQLQDEQFLILDLGRARDERSCCARTSAFNLPGSRACRSGNVGSVPAMASLCIWALQRHDNLQTIAVLFVFFFTAIFGRCGAYRAAPVDAFQRHG